MKIEIDELAEIVSRVAHAGQKRKYVGGEYFKHPKQVRDTLVFNYSICDARTQAVAYLHDVVEDTGVDFELLECIFPASVVEDVRTLTKPVELKGSKDLTNELYRDRLRKGSACAQNVKCADIISNTFSIVDRDPNFAKRYLPEKLRQILAMPKALPSIRDAAEDQVISQLERIK